MLIYNKTVICVCSKQPHLMNVRVNNIQNKNKNSW